MDWSQYLIVFIIVAVAGGLVWIFVNRNARETHQPDFHEHSISESNADSLRQLDKNDELPDEGLFCKIGNFKIRYNYIDKSSDKTFVLVHGIGASKYCWRYFIPLVETLGNVLVMDLPGFGESTKQPDFSHDVISQAELIHQLIEKTCSEEVVLVGSSMGGTISMAMANKFPQKYKKMILLSPGLAPIRARFLHIPSIFVVSKWVGEKVASRNFIKKIVERTVYDQNLVTDEVVDQYYQFYENNMDAILCFVKASENFTDGSLWQKIEGVTADVLLLWGKKDAITPYRYMNRFLKRYPNWDSKVKPDCGHHLQEECPEWLFEHTAKFLKD